MNLNYCSNTLIITCMRRWDLSLNFDSAYVCLMPDISTCCLYTTCSHVRLVTSYLQGFTFWFQSWEAVDRSSSNFTPDITPLILAAHKNNYEILKILLDRGATLPTPHDARYCFRFKNWLFHCQCLINNSICSEYY